MKLCGMILQLKNAVDYENIEEVLEIEENITIWSLPEWLPTIYFEKFAFIEKSLVQKTRKI